MTMPDTTVHAGQGALGAGFTAYDPVLPPLTAERVPPGDADRGGAGAGGRARGVAAALDLQRHVARAHPARPGRRRLRGHPRQPRHHGPLRSTSTPGHGRPTRRCGRSPPGGSLTYRFTATRAGIWMYHCSTMPMSAHIAAGLVGRGRHRAARTWPPSTACYLLVQSELYLGASTARGTAGEVDATKAQAEHAGRRRLQRHRRSSTTRRPVGPGGGAGALLGARRRTEPCHQLPRRRGAARRRLRRGRLAAPCRVPGRESDACRSPPRRVASSRRPSPSPATTPSSATSWPTPNAGRMARWSCGHDTHQVTQPGKDLLMCSYCGCADLEVVGRFMAEHEHIINHLSALRELAPRRAPSAGGRRPGARGPPDAARRGRGGGTLHRHGSRRALHRPHRHGSAVSTTSSTSCWPASPTARSPSSPASRTPCGTTSTARTTGSSRRRPSTSAGPSGTRWSASPRRQERTDDDKKGERHHNDRCP